MPRRGTRSACKNAAKKTWRRSRESFVESRRMALVNHRRRASFVQLEVQAAAEIHGPNHDIARQRAEAGGQAAKVGTQRTRHRDLLAVDAVLGDPQEIRAAEEADEAVDRDPH